MEQEIYGPPRADSVKGRLHVLENYNATERAASAATSALSSALSARASSRERRLWAAAGAAITLLNIAVSNHWHWP